MEITKVETEAFIALILGAVLSFIIPLIIALVWKIKKNKLRIVV